MTKEQFIEYDKKLIAYEWIVDCPSNAYDFILELIEENKHLEDTNTLLRESNTLAAKLLELKHYKK